MDLSKQIEQLRYDLSLSEYRNKILCQMVDERDTIIKNLRKDLDGITRTVEDLRSLNNSNDTLVRVLFNQTRKDAERIAELCTRLSHWEKV